MTKMILCGVGGQGTILAAHVLALAALNAGHDVKVSEIHGMAQRGGAVSTMVAIGENVASMVVGQGEANVIIAFEKMEALRNITSLSLEGTLIVNDEIIRPASVLTGRSKVPDDLDDRLDELDAILIPAEGTAREAGNAKAANIVLLGAAAEVLGFPEEAWMDAIRQTVPSKTVDVNLKAFEAGRAYMHERSKGA